MEIFRYVSRITSGILVTLLLAVLWIVGCGGSSQIDSSAHTGRTVFYVPGVPNFDLEAIATWKQGKPGIDVYVGIPHASLIYLRAGSEFVARYEALVQVVRRKGKQMMLQEEWVDTLRTLRYEETQSYEPHLIVRRVSVPSGEYVVKVTLTDLNSGKQAVRQQRIQVVALEEDQPYLSRIRLDVRRHGKPFEPAVSFHLPSALDSIRAVVHLYHAAPHGAEVTMRLLKFRSDTTVAAPPYWLSPMIGSLRYKGVDYDHADTLQVTHRVLDNIGDEVEIDFVLPGLSRGIYRIQVQTVVRHPEKDLLLTRQRDVSIKGPGFPRLTTLDELIDALAYIAYDRELAYIRAASTPQEKKRRFDAFWGSLVQNRQVAANLLKLYYSRVEEANLFFTTYKEGWKTDQGMVYIVMGPPVVVEHFFDTEVWYYSYADRDPLNTFTFERARPYGANALFRNYFLRRRPIYEQMWIRAVERWRSGAVL